MRWLEITNSMDISSERWWRTEKPGMLQSMRLQRVNQTTNNGLNIKQTAILICFIFIIHLPGRCYQVLPAGKGQWVSPLSHSKELQRSYPASSLNTLYSQEFLSTCFFCFSNAWCFYFLSLNLYSKCSLYIHMSLKHLFLREGSHPWLLRPSKPVTCLYLMTKFVISHLFVGTFDQSLSISYTRL